MNSRKRKTRGDLAEEVAKAHTDLNIFAAIEATLEGGIVSADVQPDDFAIIRICQRAQQRCLRRYDNALAALKSAV